MLKRSQLVWTADNTSGQPGFSEPSARFIAHYYDTLAYCEHVSRIPDARAYFRGGVWITYLIWLEVATAAVGNYSRPRSSIDWVLDDGDPDGPEPLPVAQMWQDAVHLFYRQVSFNARVTMSRHFRPHNRSPYWNEKQVYAESR